uniref:Uncharacterized protein n=1 Tax=uncultured Desulfobacterium sp. TaxID=201089 RepID=E1YK06_9BACT|nr:unknown protein [uncultured Desulfobacterium sp.]
MVNLKLFSVFLKKYLKNMPDYYNYVNNPCLLLLFTLKTGFSNVY